MSWLISKALMNSLCSQELVEEYSGENSSDGEQSAQLNGSLTQQAYCAPDKMTDFCRLSQLATHAGGKLNPMWIEWLMGWPINWTDLKPLVMDKSHCVQQKHGDFCANN